MAAMTVILKFLFRNLILNTLVLIDLKLNKMVGHFEKQDGCHGHHLEILFLVTSGYQRGDSGKHQSASYKSIIHSMNIICILIFCILGYPGGGALGDLFSFFFFF